MIKLNIPLEAMQEMATSSPAEAYDKLIESGNASLMNLLAFGLINTRIREDETGEQVGVIIYWANGMITACHIDPEKPQVCRLMGTYGGYDHNLTAKDAVEIYNRALKEDLGNR